MSFFRSLLVSVILFIAKNLFYSDFYDLLQTSVWLLYGFGIANLTPVLVIVISRPWCVLTTSLSAKGYPLESHGLESLV